jgi:hypothetical protein
VATSGRQGGIGTPEDGALAVTTEPTFKGRLASHLVALARHCWHGSASDPLNPVRPRLTTQSEQTTCTPRSEVEGRA